MSHMKRRSSGCIRQFKLSKQEPSKKFEHKKPSPVKLFQRSGSKTMVSTQDILKQCQYVMEHVQNKQPVESSAMKRLQAYIKLFNRKVQSA